MSIKLIYASDLNNVIGYEGKIPWYIPEDLKRFKELTTNKIVVMGRLTFESLPDKFKPLPNRTNIVLTRNTLWRFPNVITYNSFSEVLKNYNSAEVFVIGGEAVLKEALPYADTIYQTLVLNNFQGDTFGPDWTHHEWDLSDFSDHEHEGLKYQFRTFKRR